MCVHCQCTCISLENEEGVRCWRSINIKCQGLKRHLGSPMSTATKWCIIAMRPTGQHFEVGCRAFWLTRAWHRSCAAKHGVSAAGRQMPPIPRGGRLSGARAAFSSGPPFTLNSQFQYRAVGQRVLRNARACPVEQY